MEPNSRYSPTNIWFNSRYVNEQLERSPTVANIPEMVLAQIEEESNNPFVSRINTEIDEYSRRIAEAINKGIGGNEVEILEQCRHALRKRRDEVLKANASPVNVRTTHEVAKFMEQWSATTPKWNPEFSGD